MTNLQIVTAALQMLGVLDANETPSAEDGALGLSQLNDVMALLEADGVELGFPPQDSLSDDFPMSDQIGAQVKPILAVALQTFYPAAQVTPMLAARAASASNQLMREAAIGNADNADLSHVPNGEGFRRHSSILTDD